MPPKPKGKEPVAGPGMYEAAAADDGGAAAAAVNDPLARLPKERQTEIIRVAGAKIEEEDVETARMAYDRCTLMKKVFRRIQAGHEVKEENAELLRRVWPELLKFNESGDQSKLSTAAKDILYFVLEKKKRPETPGVSITEFCRFFEGWANNEGAEVNAAATLMFKNVAAALTVSIEQATRMLKERLPDEFQDLIEVDAILTSWGLRHPYFMLTKGTMNELGRICCFAAYVKDHLPLPNPNSVTLTALFDDYWLNAVFGPRVQSFFDEFKARREYWLLKNAEDGEDRYVFLKEGWERFVNARGYSTNPDFVECGLLDTFIGCLREMAGSYAKTEYTDADMKKTIPKLFELVQGSGLHIEGYSEYATFLDTPNVRTIVELVDWANRGDFKGNAAVPKGLLDLARQHVRTFKAEQRNYELHCTALKMLVGWLTTKMSTIELVDDATYQVILKIIHDLSKKGTSLNTLFGVGFHFTLETLFKHLQKAMKLVHDRWNGKYVKCSEAEGGVYRRKPHKGFASNDFMVREERGDSYCYKAAGQWCLSPEKPPPGPRTVTARVLGELFAEEERDDDECGKYHRIESGNQMIIFDVFVKCPRFGSVTDVRISSRFTEMLNSAGTAVIMGFKCTEQFYEDFKDLCGLTLERFELKLCPLPLDAGDKFFSDTDLDFLYSRFKYNFQKLKELNLDVELCDDQGRYSAIQVLTQLETGVCTNLKKITLTSRSCRVKEPADYLSLWHLAAARQLTHLTLMNVDERPLDAPLYIPPIPTYLPFLKVLHIAERHGGHAGLIGTVILKEAFQSFFTRCPNLKDLTIDGGLTPNSKLCIQKSAIEGFVPTNVHLERIKLRYSQYCPPAGNIHGLVSATCLQNRTDILGWQFAKNEYERLPALPPVEGEDGISIYCYRVAASCDHGDTTFVYVRNGDAEPVRQECAGQELL